MKTIVIAVRDQQSQLFTQPFTAASPGVALRSWANQLNDPDNRKSDQVQHPHDFTLWKIGEYDDQTGTIEGCTPEQLAVASNLIMEK